VGRQSCGRKPADNGPWRAAGFSPRGLAPTMSSRSVARLQTEPSSDSKLEATTLLAARLREKDATAGEELHRLYRDALVRFCWGYLGILEEAEDAASEILCKVLAGSTVPDAFRPWLYKIARNHCLNLVRDRANRRDRVGMPSASKMPESLTGNLTRLVREEMRSELADFVRTLPEAQQEVLRLRYVEDLSRAEIAEVLDVPEPVVKSRLFEGMKTLREYAERLERGGD